MQVPFPGRLRIHRHGLDGALLGLRHSRAAIAGGRRRGLGEGVGEEHGARTEADATQVILVCAGAQPGGRVSTRSGERAAFEKSRSAVTQKI